MTPKHTTLSLIAGLAVSAFHGSVHAQVECSPTRLELASPDRVSSGPIAGGVQPGKVDFAPPTDPLGNPGRTLITRDLGRRPGKGAESDLDADGRVTLVDLILFLEAFDAVEPLADVDRDGDVTFADFLMFFDQFDRGA